MKLLFKFDLIRRTTFESFANIATCIILKHYNNSTKFVEYFSNMYFAYHNSETFLKSNLVFVINHLQLFEII